MSVIRRISEDSRFRPFLSTHFDAEAYIRSVIKEGRSEEVFADLEACIAEVSNAGCYLLLFFKMRFL
jgi:hypothetical protein